MEKKINIVELLKDCPQGMELDCMMYEDVFFDYVDELNIIHCYINHEGFKTSIIFNQHGTPNSNTKSKCVIFPKGKTTWEGFVPPYQFQDGDVVFGRNTACSYITIYKHSRDKISFYYYAGLTSLGHFLIDNFADNLNLRLATEEEKQKLFDSIKANGYKWNSETKTLEKLVEPYFKVGNRIKHKTDKWQAKRTIQTFVSGIGYITTINDWVRLEDQDNWELVPNKFDITTLKPFDKVLVRTNVHNPVWSIDFYGGYDIKVGGSFTPFAVTGGKYFQQCIPYEGNEHLRGTTNDCDDFYKTWENENRNRG